MRFIRGTMRFIKHALELVWVFLFIPQVWKFIVWLLDWQGRVELVIADYREGHFGAVIEFLLNPPPWTIFPVVGIGVLLLITWDVRRSRLVSNKGSEQQRQLRREFGKLTTSQLRDETKEVTDAMRALEQEYRTAMDNVLLKRIDWNATSEEKSKIWEANNERYKELGEEREVAFRNQCLAKARSLREAILARVPDIIEGLPPPSPHARGAAVLDSGRLTGPNPIACAADYLESLSRTLP